MAVRVGASSISPSRVKARFADRNRRGEAFFHFAPRGAASLAQKLLDYTGHEATQAHIAARHLLAARPGWTRQDPRTIDDYRIVAGLPDQNHGRFFNIGVLRDLRDVHTRAAKPYMGRGGGLDEVVVPDAESKIDLEEVIGLAPPF